MKKFLGFLFLFFATLTNCFSQFSKTHYIPPLSCSPKIISEEQYLYISTPSVTPINFKIIEIGGQTIPGTVSKSTPFVYYIGTGNDTQLLVDADYTNFTFSNKGYIVEADDLVYVSARLTAGAGPSSGLALHAGEIVSKGLASLGKRFRVGAFINTQVPITDDVITTFVSVLATEDNTTINFSGFKNGVSLVNSTTGSSPFSVTLNNNESYVIAVKGISSANKDGLIGALVTSNKAIAVNCGSFTGSNGEMSNLDLGFDQIVSAERTGKEYIFIKSTGLDNVERALLVADEDNTDVFLNGATVASYTLNAGQYVALNGADYTVNGNLYVQTSKNVFAYQSVGDNGTDPKTNLPYQANQEMFFVPPLSCQTPKIIDNIPFIDQIGTKKYIGRVTIITKSGASLDFTINNKNYSLNTLPAYINVDGPTNVTGNPNYQTYTITGLTGNISVKSSGELYLAAYGSNAAATFGGFYSGFTFKPEIAFNKADVTKTSCLPNIKLEINSLNPFDDYQWYLNNVLIPGATNSSYIPTTAGYYYVSATISNCGSPVISDKIPVSFCPNDFDIDGSNNNVDLDNDHDGITNCTESYGNQYLDLSNINSGKVNIGNYSNSYNGNTIADGGASPTPVIGYSDGNFTTQTLLGKNNTITYSLSSFSKPMSLTVEYTSLLNTNDLLTSDTEIRITCPFSKTLTIVNPNNQILIDTNYDGIFESNITEYSSFEIRFRLNGSIPLVSGTGTFSIRGDLIDSLSIANINLSDVSNSSVSLRIVATCVPKDSDNDGIPDQLDLDSDNDSILDIVESQGQNYKAPLKTDINNDGIDDAFGNGTQPYDNDGDGYPDYLDLDSDNDGIYDLVESNSKALDSDLNGMIDGSDFGNNGLANSVETSPDNGKLNYTLADTDADGNHNYIDLDSDNDWCNDVVEAGFTDSNNDGLLGSSTPTLVNSYGLVTSGLGYTLPNPNYLIATPILITTQPTNVNACNNLQTQITINSNADSFQWEVSLDNGVSWSTINNNSLYNGATSKTLSIISATLNMSGFQYRVFLNRIGNVCGTYSSIALLNVNTIPQANVVPLSYTTTCDDEIDPLNQDGIYNFDTSTFDNQIVMGQTNVKVLYFDQNNNPLPSPLPNPFTTASQILRAVVKNSVNENCSAEVKIPFVVNPIPKISLVQDKFVCLPNTQPISISPKILDGTPASAYAYQWFENNSVINNQITSSLVINDFNTYSVKVTNAKNCETTSQINVQPSEKAILDTIDVEDLADINSIAVHVSGAGNYVYALDNINGPYQDSNIFNNVTIGIHEVFVQDKNGCGSLGPISVPVFGVPKYFTPNGDGYNDYWNIKSLEVPYNLKATIYIMDRYGKLVTQIITPNQGWDGTLHGKEMPSDDYWYIIQLEDGKTVKGHFALKR